MGCKGTHYFSNFHPIGRLLSSFKLLQCNKYAPKVITLGAYAVRWMCLYLATFDFAALYFLFTHYLSRRAVAHLHDVQTFLRRADSLSADVVAHRFLSLSICLYRLDSVYLLFHNHFKLVPCRRTFILLLCSCRNIKGGCSKLVVIFNPIVECIFVYLKRFFYQRYYRCQACTAAESKFTDTCYAIRNSYRCQA